MRRWGTENMKEQKPLRLGQGEQDWTGSEAAPGQNGEQKGAAQRLTDDRTADVTALRPGPAMHENELNTRHRSRGRLGRDVQSKLGKTLQAYFDDVVKEGVPDRFKSLLEQLDGNKNKGSN